MMDYQAAYVRLREGVLAALEAPDGQIRETLNLALNEADTATDERDPDRSTVPKPTPYG